MSAFIDSMQRGFGQIPPIAIALVLLAGPTAALIGYRFISAATRLQAAPKVEAAPKWVCPGCRSVNELRVSHCYRCGLERDPIDALEFVIDQPAARPGSFEVPAGSPFAAVAGVQPRPGVPVMAGPDAADERVAVGPGHHPDAVPTDSAAEPTRLVEADR
ncbi:MAG: zinc finger Ran-binding domain-containing protein [Candidatus Limnocylindrales bacterium]